MANKNDNTIFWIVGLGIAGCLWYKHNQAVLLASATATSSPGNASSSAPYQPVLNQPGTALLLPPSTTINTSAPAGGSSNSPATLATGIVPVNTTGLQTIQVSTAPQPVAVNANGTPILAPTPMTFQTVSQQPSSAQQIFAEPSLSPNKAAITGYYDMGECL